jgi:hypothetical protein
MRISGWGVLLLGCVLAVGTAHADGFVEFRDGRYIKADAVVTPGGTVRIELNRSSWLEIPVAVVDAVERGGRLVYQRPAITETDVLLAGESARPSIDLLVEDVLRARRRLPDPASFRPSSFALANRFRKTP